VGAIFTALFVWAAWVLVFTVGHVSPGNALWTFAGMGMGTWSVWFIVVQGGVRRVAGRGVCLGRRCVPAGDVRGLGLARRPFKALPGRYWIPTLVLEGGGRLRLTPFASFWPGSGPTSRAAGRAPRLAAFLGVPYLGELPGGGLPGRWRP
jgi:hypothetical protein